MKKCTLFGNKVEYLGRVTRPAKLEVDNAHTASLRQAKLNVTKSELLRFLGFLNVYQRFITEFTVLSSN